MASIHWRIGVEIELSTESFRDFLQARESWLEV